MLISLLILSSLVYFYIHPDKNYILNLIKNSKHSKIFFIVFYSLSSAIFFPTTLLTATEGFYFGFIQGTLFSAIGATLGSTIAFFYSKIFSHKFFEYFIKNKIKKFLNKSYKYEFFFILMIRLCLIPFMPVSYLLGMMKINPLKYIIATFIGILPGTLFLCYTTASISNKTFDFKSITILLLLFIISIIIGYKMQKK